MLTFRPRYGESSSGRVTLAGWTRYSNDLTLPNTIVLLAMTTVEIIRFKNIKQDL